MIFQCGYLVTVGDIFNKYRFYKQVSSVIAVPYKYVKQDSVRSNDAIINRKDNIVKYYSPM